MQNVSWYWPLANRAYQDAFCYVSPAIENRNHIIKNASGMDMYKQSDVVKLIL